MKKNYKVNLTMEFVYDLYKSKVFMAQSRSDEDLQNAQKAWKLIEPEAKSISVIILEVAGKKRRMTLDGHVSKQAAQEAILDKFGPNYIDLDFEHSYTWKRGRIRAFKVAEILPLLPYFSTVEVSSESENFSDLEVAELRRFCNNFTLITK